VQTSVTSGGEPVTIEVTGQLTANLSGETPPALPIPTPALGPVRLVLLSVAGMAGVRALRS
jgi:hypothetical protein